MQLLMKTFENTILLFNPDEMEHNSDLWYFSDQQFTKSYISEIDFDNLFFVDNLIRYVKDNISTLFGLATVISLYLNTFTFCFLF